MSIRAEACPSRSTPAAPTRRPRSCARSTRHRRAPASARSSSTGPIQRRSIRIASAGRKPDASPNVGPTSSTVTPTPRSRSSSRRKASRVGSAPAGSTASWTSAAGTPVRARAPATKPPNSGSRASRRSTPIATGTGVSSRGRSRSHANAWRHAAANAHRAMSRPTGRSASRGRNTSERRTPRVGSSQWTWASTATTSPFRSTRGWNRSSNRVSSRLRAASASSWAVVSERRVRQRSNRAARPRTAARPPAAARSVTRVSSRPWGPSPGPLLPASSAVTSGS